MSEEMSGRQVLLMQQDAGRRLIIDCCLGMAPGWISAFRDYAADNQQILDALESDALDKPSQITPHKARS